MKRTFPILFLFCLLFTGCGNGNQNKSQVDLAKIEQSRVLKAADGYLNSQIITVTDTVSSRSEGGRIRIIPTVPIFTVTG